MKKVLFLLIILLLISGIYAQCNETQININTASEEELDKLYGIGVVKAEAIINARFFESVDDLITVYGIGNITLNKIKQQGLACVEAISEIEESEETAKSNDIKEEILIDNSEVDSDIKETVPVILNTINLNPALHEN